MKFRVYEMSRHIDISSKILELGKKNIFHVLYSESSELSLRLL